jgi:ATP-dependent DNA helicase RecQ
LGLNKLSTYGLLSRLKQDDVVGLIDGLITCGCLRQEEIMAARPVVRMTQRGEEVMYGRESLPAGLKLPAYLFDKIRRGQITSGNKRPDVAPVQHQPNAAPLVRFDADENGDVEPGDACEWTAETATSDPERARRGDDAPPEDEDIGRRRDDATIDDAQPEHYWTWRLLYEGYSPAQCAAIRRISPEQVIDHATQAAEEDRPVLLEWFLDRRQIDALERVVQGATSRQIRPLLKQLPEGILYEHVQLYLRRRG